MTTSEADRLTRDELYGLVWSEPLRSLAPRFGLSDVGLAKACRRMKIPLPGRGYWRQKETGHPVRRAPLRPLPENAPRDQREFRVRERQPLVSPSGSEIAGPLAMQMRYEADASHRIIVPPELIDPHPLVTRARRSLQHAGMDARGYLQARTHRCLAIHTSRGTLDRALRIMDALIKALEVRGFTVAIGDDSTRPLTLVRVLGETLGIVLEETITRVERPTPRRRAGTYDVLGWASPQYDLVPTGVLSLRIDAADSPGVRKSWTDGKTQRVETSLNAVALGLVRAALAKVAERERRAEQQRRWQEAERQRRIEAERRARTAAQRRVLQEEASRWRTACALRAYIDAVETAAADAPLSADGRERLAAWTSWARQHTDQLDSTVPLRAGGFEGATTFLRKVTDPDPQGDDWRWP